MWSFQDNMSSCVYKLFFLLSKSSSQQKDHSLFFIGDGFDDSIRKGMPSDILMGIRLVFSYRQAGIQQEYSLLCPFGQVSTFRRNNSYIILQFLENIFQRRRLPYSILNGKA